MKSPCKSLIVVVRIHALSLPNNTEIAGNEKNLR